MKIIIKTMDNLPEYCWNCPCCSSVGRCRADKERRKTSEYRPYWCPLSEEQEQATSEESAHLGADLRGADLRRATLMGANLTGLIYSVPLHIEEEENIYIAKRGRCGKTVDIEIIGDMLIDYYNKKEEEKVSIAQCNRCGKIVRRNLTTIVKIRHGGTSVVNYPHEGEFRICKDCEQLLLKQLTSNKEGGTKND